MTGTQFPHSAGPLCRRIHWWPVAFRHNEQYCEAFMFILLLDRCWTNIPVAGELRCHDTHVMSYNKPLPEQLLAKITAASKSLEDNELTST